MCNDLPVVYGYRNEATLTIRTHIPTHVHVHTHTPLPCIIIKCLDLAPQRSKGQDNRESSEATPFGRNRMKSEGCGHMRNNDNSRKVMLQMCC